MFAGCAGKKSIKKYITSWIARYSNHIDILDILDILDKLDIYLYEHSQQ